MGRVPFIHDRKIARAAAELIRAHQAGDPTFALPYSLEELIWDHLYEVDGLGFDDETALGSHSESGEAILGKTIFETKIIYIDPSVKTQPYYRFTLAHEIGHWILHCRPHLPDPNQLFLFDQTANSEDDHPREFTTYHRAILSPSSVLDWEEVQANKFAACLLMPEAEVRQAFNARFSEPQLYPSGDPEALLTFARPIVTQKSGDLPSLCDLFGTSMESMTYRLNALGLIQEDSPFFS